MIYLFTWNSDFLVSDAVKKWKNQFVEKYGDFNLLHIKWLDENNLESYHQNLLSVSFMNEKKLIILDINWDESDEIKEFITKNLDKIPDNNILLINYPKPDKRSKLFKDLEKISQKKDFNTDENNDLSSVLKARYNNIISTWAINLICKYKANNLQKIVSEIEKLNILHPYIDEKIVNDFIIPELEENIFWLVDNILDLNLNETYKKINIILNDVNIYLFYNSLLSIIRTSIFILKLRNENVSPKEIVNVLNLGSKSFLATKNYRMSYKTASKLYINLIELDKKMKTWNMIWTEDSDFKFELENCLLKIAS